jgi:hypothetical protein
MPVIGEVVLWMWVGMVVVGGATVSVSNVMLSGAGTRVSLLANIHKVCNQALSPMPAWAKIGLTLRFKCVRARAPHAQMRA